MDVLTEEHARGVVEQQMRKLEAQEDLILQVTEAISVVMEQKGVTKADLAKRMGRSKGFISQCLAGGHNLTLRTIADIAAALDVSCALNLAEKKGRPL